jgi:hypothetical protein
MKRTPDEKTENGTWEWRAPPANGAEERKNRVAAMIAEHHAAYHPSLAYPPVPVKPMINILIIDDGARGLHGRDMHKLCHCAPGAADCFGIDCLR